MKSEQTPDLNPFGVLFTLCMGLLLLLFPRRKALIPLVLMTCYMTFGQQVVLMSLHFTMLRLIVLVGCVRVVVRGEFRRIRWLRMDTLVVLWVMVTVIVYTMLWQTTAALVNRLGFAYDSLGLYFICRSLIADTEDITRACRVFAWALAPVAVCMIAEKLTGQNPFFVFGGVPRMTELRNGVVRCQGPFRHPILAGTFGAIWIPLLTGLWRQKGSNGFLVGVGITAAMTIAALSGSSGPVATLLLGVVGLLCWPMKKQLRMIRWTVIGAILMLQLVMQAPVWFIFAKVNILSGSTGWHRAYLIDRTVAHFSEWWLFGAKSVAPWGVWAGDVTNQYVIQGINGGFLGLVLFVAIIISAFASIGMAMRAREGNQWVLWTIGCTLFAHSVTFLSVSYFDQNIVNWYLVLAMSCAVRPVHRKVGSNVPEKSKVRNLGDVCEVQSAGPIQGSWS
ncbi:MAG: hypothetical protein J0H49_29360 [Acidobacteria bacterium]|nr:hypothetical protein [Acidobacteriota bacterium]